MLEPEIKRFQAQLQHSSTAGQEHGVAWSAEASRTTFSSRRVAEGRSSICPVWSGVPMPDQHLCIHAEARMRRTKESRKPGYANGPKDPPSGMALVMVVWLTLLH